MSGNKKIEGKSGKTKAPPKISAFNFKSPIPALVPPVLREVGKLAAGVASVSTNFSGSATGNPRNKVALQPGHSLMDWIRLGTSGKDLTGLGSKSGSIAVTRQELSKHNKRWDAWTAVRGKVYNLTEYFSFHPGGEDELMRGAGIDATNIFDEIHPWVNYEQILQKCLIGKLVAVDPNIDTESLFFSENNSLSPDTNNSTKIERASENLITNTADKGSKIQLNESLPRFDWIQKLDYVTVIFYTKSCSNPVVEVSYPENEQNIEICLKYEGISYKNKILFQKPIHWAYEINLIIESGKVEVKFKKLISGIWDNFGILQQNIDDEECFKFKYILKEKTQVNYNTWLLKFLRSDRKKIIIPVGYHIRIYGLFDGKEISRSYTPVPENVLSNSVPHNSAEEYLYFLIKRYPDGKISPFITDSNIENELEFTKPIGTFNLKLIEKKETFLLLAAGTGITPMLSLIIFLLGRRIRRCQFIRLLFFNRTESDIILREQLESLALKDKRLKIDNILSRPQEDWKGLKGLVNSNLIENSLNHHLKDTGYTIKGIFCFICGPPNFNKLAITQLEEIKFSLDQIHCFEG